MNQPARRHHRKGAGAAPSDGQDAQANETCRRQRIPGMSDSQGFHFGANPSRFWRFVLPGRSVHRDCSTARTLAHAADVYRRHGGAIGKRLRHGISGVPAECERRVREQLQHLLQKAELDEPDGYRRVIDVLKKNADLLAARKPASALPLCLAPGVVPWRHFCAGACGRSCLCPKHALA